MSIPQVIDGVTELDSELFNPIINRVNGLQTGETPIPLAGIEGALGEYEPLQNMRAGGLNAWDFIGVDPTGVLSSSTGLTDFFNACSQQRVPGTIPPGTYLINPYIQAPSYLTIYAYGAMFVTAHESDLFSCIEFRNRQWVNIYGLSVNGNRAAWPGSTAQYKHAIAFLGSRHIRLYDITLMDNVTDGLFFGLASSGGCADVVASGVVSTGNGRLGLAITALDGGTFRSCTFSFSNGVNPESGVDIEPGNATNIVRNIVFESPVITGNTGHGFVVHTDQNAAVPQHGIQINGGSIRDNAKAGVLFYSARGVTLRDVSITDNGWAGLEASGQFGDVTDLLVDGGEIRDNGTYGVVGMSNATHAFRRPRFRDVRISGPNTQTGIDLRNTVDAPALLNVPIDGFATGLVTGSGVTNLLLDRIDPSGCATPLTLGDDAGSRVERDTIT